MRYFVRVYSIFLYLTILNGYKYIYINIYEKVILLSLNSFFFTCLNLGSYFLQCCTFSPFHLKSRFASQREKAPLSQNLHEFQILDGQQLLNKLVQSVFFLKVKLFW